ncbi:MAG: ribosomal S27a family protein [Candidatus ainarchaeum sp.]|nr:ribosomal S27a family protein [Candidatus ainarchaeum sp.]
MAKKGSGVKKGKTKHKPTVNIKVSKFYKVDGTAVSRLGKDCPKCGVSVKMGAHKTKEGKTRFACGKCGMNVWE